jgi:hypothetical protein
VIEAAGGDEPQTGSTLYRAACASCHGTQGRGAPVRHVGFEVPLPDFTDCSFASREPDADWIAVAQGGGPVRAFSELMPAFGEILTMEQLVAIMDHIRGFCPDQAWPRGELNLPRPLVTEKAYPEDEAVLSSAITTDGPKSITNKMIYEKRFGARNQVEIVIPFGWREVSAQGSTGDQAWGIGDMAVGIKRVLAHSLKHGTIVSITGEVIVPTGDDEEGFGKGTTIFEPFLTYGQILPADFFLQSQLGLEIPDDSNKAEKEAFLRLALGRSLTLGRSDRVWSPMIEVLGGRELADGEEISWDLVPQVQVTLNRRQHVMLNLGVRSPLNNTAGRDTQVLLYVLWDWFDGGLFDGW